jgi:hypothetical protein
MNDTLSNLYNAWLTILVYEVICVSSGAGRDWKTVLAILVSGTILVGIWAVYEFAKYLLSRKSK